MFFRESNHQPEQSAGRSAARRVALVHDHLVQDGGAEQVLRVLMRMWPEAPVYTFVCDAQGMGLEFRRADIRTSAWQRLPAATRYYKSLLPAFDRAFRGFDLSEYELVVSSASGFAKSVRTGPQTLHLCYCHTPTRYLWRDSDAYIAELRYPAAVKAMLMRMRPRLRAADLRGARGVDEYVANSTFVADQIERHYGRRATVVHPPVQIDRFAPAPSRRDYLLVASRLRPHKRVDLAIAAANALRLPLKVMGSGSEREPLKRMAGPTVEFLGRVSDTHRRRLFGEAKAFLNPQEEDFGITTVEALASGTPVIAYGKGGAAEIIDHGMTGVLFSEQTTASLVGAILALPSYRFDAATLRRSSEAFSEAAFERHFSKVVEDSFRRHQTVRDGPGAK